MRNKSNNLNKGNYIIENKEKLLHQRKNRKKVRNLILLVIIMISTLITLCIKLPYFNIKSIEITGNINDSKAEINDIAKIDLGSNIFYDTFSDSKKKIMENPYILNVKVKRVLPNRIIIEIKEKVAVFYGKVNSTYYIIDNKGSLLEKRSDIKDMNLVNLVGFNYEKFEVGNLIAKENDRKLGIIVAMSNIINDYKKTNKNSKISLIDVSDVLDVKILYGNMYIKFGTIEDLKNKFNKAINIITLPQYKNAKGYVDVSFNGNPVIYVKQK